MTTCCVMGKWQLPMNGIPTGESRADKYNKVFRRDFQLQTRMCCKSQ